VTAAGGIGETIAGNANRQQMWKAMEDKLHLTHGRNGLK
jgi:hypothetical protein